MRANKNLTASVKLNVVKSVRMHFFPSIYQFQKSVDLSIDHCIGGTCTFILRQFLLAWYRIVSTVVDGKFSVTYRSIHIPYKVEISPLTEFL